MCATRRKNEELKIETSKANCGWGPVERWCREGNEWVITVVHMFDESLSNIIIGEFRSTPGM